MFLLHFIFILLAFLELVFPSIFMSVLKCLHVSCFTFYLWTVIKYIHNAVIKWEFDVKSARGGSGTCSKLCTKSTLIGTRGMNVYFRNNLLSHEYRLRQK